VLTSPSSDAWQDAQSVTNQGSWSELRLFSGVNSNLHDWPQLLREKADIHCKSWC
jgi:hypothetical protein